MPDTREGKFNPDVPAVRWDGRDVWVVYPSGVPGSFHRRQLAYARDHR